LIVTAGPPDAGAEVDEAVPGGDDGPAADEDTGAPAAAEVDGEDAVVDELQPATRTAAEPARKDRRLRQAGTSGPTVAATAGVWGVLRCTVVLLSGGVGITGR